METAGGRQGADDFAVEGTDDFVRGKQGGIDEIF